MQYWYDQYPELFGEYISQEIFDFIDLLEFNELSLEKTLTRIRELEDKDRQRAHQNGKEYILDKLRKLKGIGEHIARTFVWYIGDFNRFSNAKKLVVILD